MFSDLWRFVSLALAAMALGGLPGVDECRAQAVFELYNKGDYSDVQALIPLSDGKRMVTLVHSRPMKISMWDLESGEEKTIAQREFEWYGSLSYRLSADQSRLVYATKRDNALNFEFVDLVKGAAGRSVSFRSTSYPLPDEFREYPTRVAYSADLSRAVCLFVRDNPRNDTPHSAIRVYDTSNGNQLVEFTPHRFDREERRRERACAGFALSPDEKWIATVGSDRKAENLVRVWEVATGKMIAEANVQPTDPRWLSATANTVAWTGERALACLSVGELKDDRQYRILCQKLVMEADSPLKVGKAWEAAPVVQIPRISGDYVKTARFAADRDHGIKFVAGGERFLAWSHEYLQVFETSTGGQSLTPAQLQPFLGIDDDNVYAATITDDGKQLFYVNEASAVVRIDCEKRTTRLIRK